MWGLHFFIRSIATLIRGLVIGHPTYMYKGVKMFNLYIPLTEENLFHVITSRADETICRWHVVRWTDLTANEWRLPVKFRGNNSAGCRETRTYPRIIPVLVCFPTFWIVYQLISTSSDIAEKKQERWQPQKLWQPGSQSCGRLTGARQSPPCLKSYRFRRTGARKELVVPRSW